MSQRLAASVLAVVLSGAAVFGCGGGHSSGGGGSFTPSTTALFASVVSGANQTAATGATLQPIVIQVVDQDGLPINGATVTLLDTPPSGPSTTLTGTTVSAGRAAFSLTLTPPTGVRVIAVNATLGSVISNTITFSETEN